MLWNGKLWYPKFQNRKVWCFSFLKPCRLTSNDILIRFYELLNFVHVPIFKNAILWLYNQNMNSRYHFGYHRHFFSKISLKNCFKKKTWTLSRNIYFSALDFVFFTNFTNIDVCHIFICRSIIEYSMTMKIFSSKSMASRLFNARLNASIALLVLEKFAFELLKLTQ